MGVMALGSISVAAVIFMVAALAVLVVAFAGLLALMKMHKRSHEMMFRDTHESLRNAFQDLDKPERKPRDPVNPDKYI